VLFAQLQFALISREGSDDARCIDVTELELRLYTGSWGRISATFSSCEKADAGSDELTQRVSSGEFYSCCWRNIAVNLQSRHCVQRKLTGPARRSSVTSMGSCDIPIRSRFQFPNPLRWPSMMFSAISGSRH
jgi:hypothetical protein